MIRRLHVPLIRPEDVIPHLAKQEAHWRTGFSAKELAESWAAASPDIPRRVRAVLNTAPEYCGAELIDGFFEREVELGTAGRNSQTDLMVIAGIADGLAVIAAEGKAEESFAELVSEWNNSSGKQTRLAHLCNTLCLNPESVGSLRYQLFHRAASAIYEARRYRSRHAVMLVHSFSPTHRWFSDFAEFARAMNVPVGGPDECSRPKICEGVSLRLAWVSDLPQTLNGMRSDTTARASNAPKPGV